MSVSESSQEAYNVDRAVPQCRRPRCKEKCISENPYKWEYEYKRKSSSRTDQTKPRYEKKYGDYVLKKSTNRIHNNYSSTTASSFSTDLTESSNYEKSLSDNKFSASSSDQDYLEALIKRTKKREITWTLSENFWDDKENVQFQAITSSPIIIDDSDDTSIMAISINN